MSRTSTALTFRKTIPMEEWFNGIMASGEATPYCAACNVAASTAGDKFHGVKSRTLLLHIQQTRQPRSSISFGERRGTGTGEDAKLFAVTRCFRHLLKGHPHAMPDRKSIVSDPEMVRARAMETLFERLENLCEGAIAIDRAGRVVYVNEKYLHSLRLNHVSEAIGRPIEEIIPNSLMRRVAETGEPILLDIMELGGEQLVVTRMPIEDENRNVIGAIGFVLSDRLDNLKPLIARMGQLESDLRVARRQLSQARTARFTFDDYVGGTSRIARAKELAGRAARQSVTVLLSGETGTGKELLAQAIHNASARTEKPFVSVNVAAIPDTLIESEFFGAASGAYTGADRKGRDGQFRVADSGTLFLDEIGEMPLQL